MPQESLSIRPILERVGSIHRTIQRTVHRHDQAYVLVDAIDLAHLDFLVSLDYDTVRILVV